MLKYDQNLKLREDKIDNLAGKIQDTQNNFEDLESRFNTKAVKYGMINEQYLEIKKAFAETSDKLHITNKARHTMEIMVGEKEEDIKGYKE